VIQGQPCHGSCMKETLKGSERTNLRGQAHALKPVVKIGKSGLTEPLINAIDEALEAHELIKIKFIGFKEQKEEFIAPITEKTRSHFIGLVGNIVILYRENPDPKKRKIKTA
jgi:RNA-binding protein